MANNNNTNNTTTNNDNNNTADKSEQYSPHRKSKCEAGPFLGEILQDKK